MARISLGICLMLVVASSVIYEAQGTFLLRHYLRKNFPRKCNEFTPFANKGMIMLVTNLEGTCPKTTEFNNFFTQFKSYMTFINSASTSSKNIYTEMNTKCEGLFKAMSALTGAKGGKSVDAGALKATMLSMGKTLIQFKKNTAIMTLKQKKEMVISMVKWTKMLATFVKSASENKGKKIDITSYGLDVDANDSSIVGTTETSTSTSKTETKSGASGSASGSSKTKESSGEMSGKAFKDTTGTKTSGSPSGSPMASPSGGKATEKTSMKGSASATGGASATAEKTSMKGSASATGGASATTEGSSGEKKFTTNTANSKTSSEKQSKMSSESSRNSSSTTTVKQVESQTSKEVMSFIMELEKKYSSKSELKAFFEKLKASMQVSSNIASKTAKDYVSATRAATTKLSEAMALVSSRNVKSAKMKSNIESCKADVMKTLKELQDINSKIASAKTVSSTQQTELKQTITKWEQVTTKFVETAASSSSSSSSSSSVSSSSQQKQEGNSQMVKKD